MKRVGWALLPFGLVLAVWQGVCAAGWVDGAVLPSAVAVGRALGDQLGGGEIYRGVLVTVGRCLLGLVAGVVVGVPLGAGMALSPGLAGFFGPLVRATYALPKTAIVPLFILWFGVGVRTEVGAVLLSALLPLTIYTFHGVQGVPRGVLWSARAMGTPGWVLVWRVLLPGSLHATLAGLRIALGFSFVAGIATEMLASNDGIGKSIFVYGESGAYDYMFAAVLALVCVVSVLDFGLQRGSAYLLRWQDAAAPDV